MEQEMNNIPNNEPMNAPQAPEQVVTEQVTVTEAGPAPAMPETPKKKNNGMLIGLILCLLVAAGGIGFGVFAMMDGNAQTTELNKQISSLKKQNSDLLEQISEFEKIEYVEEELSGDIALDLLQKANNGNQEYEIGYANVYAKYNGEDKVSYWVKYYPVNVKSDEVGLAYDIIFTLNDDGEWEFELPGFTGWGPDLEEQYTVLREYYNN